MHTCGRYSSCLLYTSLPDYKEAYDKADIVVFLTAHTPFKELERREDKVILDFCGIFKDVYKRQSL